MADPNAVRALRDLLGRNDLVSHLVDVCMAISLTRSDDPTPHQVLRDAISSFAFSETEWVGVVRPHLRSLLDTPADNAPRTGDDTKRPCLACDRDDGPAEPCTCGEDVT